MISNDVLAVPPLGTFQPSPDLPTIGAYADGSSALFDGGVYGIIIKADAATFGNMYRTVAEASGGMRAFNPVPVQVVGADGALHLAPPSTVKVLPGGYTLADKRVYVPQALVFGPSSGECFGIEASAPDWAALGDTANPVTWAWENRTAQAFWDTVTDPLNTRQCLYSIRTPDSASACGSFATPAPGSRHTYRYCFEPVDATTGVSKIYVDGGTTPAAESGPFPMTLFPVMNNWESTFGPDVNDIRAGSLRIHRIFACSTPDPAVCK